MTFDAAAQPHLIEMMRAAGLHDLAGVKGAAVKVSEIIRPPHRAHESTEKAVAQAEKGGWVGCHSYAYQAICDLAHTFPPAPETCPPKPTDTPLVEVKCGCGNVPPAGSAFCPFCGARQ